MRGWYRTPASGFPDFAALAASVSKTALLDPTDNRLHLLDSLAKGMVVMGSHPNRPPEGEKGFSRHRVIRQVTTFCDLCSFSRDAIRYW